MKENSVKNNSPKDIGIWIRVSSDDQAKGESPTHHLERAKAYAASRGWTVKEVYDLAGNTGTSGKSVKEHPEARRMMDDIKRHHITGIIFSKLARLARNTKELLEFSEYFRDHNADLVSLQDAIDTSTPSGRMFYTFQAAQAQWEREEIADRQKASILIRAKLGKTINGQAPFGYQWKDRKLVIQPDEVPVRRKMYELFLQYRRKGTVAKLLNAAGHRTREGCLFHDITVARMLTCPSAKGVYYFNRVRKTGPWAGTEKPEEEWGKTECEAIVPVDLWDNVNRIIEESLKNWKKPGKVPMNPFGNRIWCQCGSKMYARTDSPKYHCRKCNRKIPVETFEELMRQELHQFYGSKEQVAIRLNDAKKNLVDTEQALAALQRQIQKTRDDMKQTHQLFLDKVLTSQGFGDLYNPAEQRLNQLLGELPKLEADVCRLKVDQVSVEEVVFEAQHLYEQWPKMDVDRKRAIVESIFEKVEIGEGKINITYSGLPSSEELCKSQQQMAPATC
jgi:site-specific DNA recombinase